MSITIMEEGGEFLKNKLLKFFRTEFIDPTITDYLKKYI